MLAVLLALFQESASVQGSVRVANALEPIPYATVEVVGTDRRASADVRGFFIIPSVPIGQWTIRARSIGYTPAEMAITVTAGGTTRVELLLSPLPLSLGAVLVTSQSDSSRVAVVGPPPVRLDAATIRAVPALAEVDVLRALQALPSVQQASDYSSALYVRGGSSDQTLISLDGVPIFNPYHLGGIFAAIDPDAVATLDMWPGAIPARMGDRLSGAVQVWTREGGRDRVTSRGSIGLVSSRASVDGPLRGGRGSYLVSIRRTYLDLFTGAAKALGAIDGTLPYHFTDAHLKGVHDLGTLGRISASAYYNAEKLANPDPFETKGEADDGFDWGSRAASLDWRQPVGGSWLLEARTGFSSFKSKIDFFGSSPSGTPVQTMRGRAYMRDALATASATWYRHTHEARIGGQLDAYRLDYDVQHAEDQFFSDILPQFQRADRLTTAALFAEDEWRVTDALNVRLGARTLTAAGQTVLMPRVGMAWRLTDKLSLEAGAGRYAQALHSFRNDESVIASFLAYDVVTPSDTGGPSRSEDIVIGGEWRGASTSVRLDAYAKRFHALPIAPLPADPMNTPLIDVDGMRRGGGMGRGVELLMRRSLGERRSLLGSYALSSASRELGPDRFTPRFDRRHKADLMGSFPVSRRVDGSVRLIAATGQPYTPVTGRFIPFAGRIDSAGTALQPTIYPIFVLGDHNSARLPGYWRVDLSARRASERRLFGRDGTLTWVFQVINALNTRNVLAAEPDAFSGRPGGELKYVPQLPILPTLALEWKF